MSKSLIFVSGDLFSVLVYLHLLESKLKNERNIPHIILSRTFLLFVKKRKLTIHVHNGNMLQRLELEENVFS